MPRQTGRRRCPRGSVCRRWRGNFWIFLILISWTRACRSVWDPGAPPELITLARRAGALEDASLLVCVYEGLTSIAEAESPFSCDIDEKVCPPDVFYGLLDELMRMVSEE